jgi:serine/threonine protein phosphatase PrpC
MLEEFKDLYDIHHWLRAITWLGLFCVIIFLLWASGGFPPQAWVLLLQLIPQIPRLWGGQGAAIMLPLLALAALSLTWLVAWGLLVWVILLLVRFHERRRRQRQGLLAWMPSGDQARDLSLLVSDAGNYATMEATLSGFMPRLRLPQKLPQEQWSTQPSIAPASHRELQSLSPISQGSSDPSTSPGPALTMLSLAQPLEVGVGWNTGITRKRNPNEDSLVVLQSTCTYQGRLVPFGLFVVADGMGGHAYGQEASRIAMQSMMHTVLQNIVMSGELSDEFLTDMLVGGVEWANQAIYQCGQERGKEMGTTITAALVVGAKAYVVNVGDSRTYLYREGTGLLQITRDHSLVATLVAFGEIKPEEIYTHPERNKVYRSLGTQESIEVDWFVVDLLSADRLLLCSDGLWEMVRDPEIERILRNGRDPARAADWLVQAALRGGGADNVSVIVVRVP